MMTLQLPGDGRRSRPQCCGAQLLFPVAAVLALGRPGAWAVRPTQQQGAPDLSPPCRPDELKAPPEDTEFKYVYPHEVPDTLLDPLRDCTERMAKQASAVKEVWEGSKQKNKLMVDSYEDTVNILHADVREVARRALPAFEDENGQQATALEAKLSPISAVLSSDGSPATEDAQSQQATAVHATEETAVHATDEATAVHAG